MERRMIAIVGAGIGGLTLAYAFQKSGHFDVTVIAHKDADDLREGYIPSSQVHFHHLVEREKKFDIPDYGPVHYINNIELFIGGQKMFKGNLEHAAVTLDQRLYLSSLIDGLKERSIPFIKTRISENELKELAQQYDLIIDCSGKIGPIADFPKNTDIDIPDQPLRNCSVGFFYGVEQQEEDKISYNILPGLGELFETATMTEHGLVRAFLLEAVPGSELDVIKGIKDPEDFTLQLKDVFQKFFPNIFERINEKDFRLVDSKAYNRMAIKPEVRIPFTTLDGTLVLGCGDSVVLNDPITGQGANAASYCANELFNVIVENKDEKWDESVGQLYWNRTREYVNKVSEWTNAMMGEPSEAFANVLGKAAQHQEVADLIVNAFADPIMAHKLFYEGI